MNHITVYKPQEMLYSVLQTVDFFVFKKKATIMDKLLIRNIIISNNVKRRLKYFLSDLALLTNISESQTTIER